MPKDKVNVHKLNPNRPGFRQQSKQNRIDRLEHVVRQIGNMPQFLLNKFQELYKVVLDVRFTYEVLGRLLQEKNLISQEEVNKMAEKVIEERKKRREEQKAKLGKEAKEKVEKEGLVESKKDTDQPVKGEIKEVMTKEQVEKELAKDDKVADKEKESIKEEVGRELMQPREDLKKTQKQVEEVPIDSNDISKGADKKQ